MGKGPVSKQTRGLPPLVRALAFGCILLALLLCAQEVLAPKGGCIDGFYAEPEDTIDVIFLGSSHANAAFAPAQMWREQGFTGYVLYSWSQPMWVSYHYAVEAFKRQTPRVVVLEGFGLCYGTTYMTPADVDGTSDDYSLRIPLSLNRAALAVAMSRCQQNSPPFYRYLPMLRYHTRWKRLTAEDFTWFFQDHATTGKGYGPLQTVEEFPVPILEGEPEETPIYPQAEEYLYKLIALCRKKDVPLVFVVTPYETSEAEYGVFRRAARICAENGVPVLDYNTPGGRDIGFDYATDLADHAHVNTAGAQKISTDLAAYLAEHYGMPDKRGDAAYAAWDEAARMEHRDAQNITLRFTLDMAEYFRLLMQDKDLAAVITTQGDATEADPSAPRAVFRQWGLDTLPLEQSGMQGLYVVDGGKVVYQKTGAGPLEYTLFWGGHDVTLRSAADNSSIAVDGEEQSRNRPGINVLVYDKVLDRVIQSISFSTLHAYSGYTA